MTKDLEPTRPKPNAGIGYIPLGESFNGQHWITSRDVVTLMQKIEQAGPDDGPTSHF